MSCAVYKYQILSQVSDWKRSLLEIHGHGLSGIKNDFSILTNSVWTVLRPVGSQSFLRGEKYRGLLISVVSCNSTCWLLSVNPRWCCVGVPTKIIKQRPWGVVCSQAKRAGRGEETADRYAKAKMFSIFVPHSIVSSEDNFFEHWDCCGNSSALVWNNRLFTSNGYIVMELPEVTVSAAASLAVDGGWRDPCLSSGPYPACSCPCTQRRSSARPSPWRWWGPGTRRSSPASARRPTSPLSPRRRAQREHCVVKRHWNWTVAWCQRTMKSNHFTVCKLRLCVVTCVAGCQCVVTVLLSDGVCYRQTFALSCESIIKLKL